MKNALFVFMLAVLILVPTSVSGKATAEAAKNEVSTITAKAKINEAMGGSPNPPLKPTERQPGFEILFALVSILVVAHLVANKGRM